MNSFFSFSVKHGLRYPRLCSQEWLELLMWVHLLHARVIVGMCEYTWCGARNWTKLSLILGKYSANRALSLAPCIFSYLFPCLSLSKYLFISSKRLSHLFYFSLQEQNNYRECVQCWHYYHLGKWPANGRKSAFVVETGSHYVPQFGVTLVVTCLNLLVLGL